jgi:hypothetical protein
MLTWLLRYPKLLGAGIAVAVVLAIGVHYKLVIGERNKLRIENSAYQAALIKAARNMELMAEDQRVAEAAAITAIEARRAARAALDKFRAGRQLDPESLAWGAQPIPVGERTRLCTALPEMSGCVE